MTAVGTRELTVNVLGRPVPQGSMKCVGVHNGIHQLIASNKRELIPWRDAIVTAARAAANLTNWRTLDEPCTVHVDFFLPRKPSVKRDFPDRQSDGDGDKYLRAVFDSLTFARVWVDDSRCCSGTWAKHYAHTHPGARITIRPLERTTTP